MVKLEITLGELLNRHDIRQLRPRFILKHHKRKTAAETGRQQKSAEYSREFILDPVIDMARTVTGHEAIIIRHGEFQADITMWPLHLSTLTKVLITGYEMSE